MLTVSVIIRRYLSSETIQNALCVCFFNQSLNDSAVLQQDAIGQSMVNAVLIILIAQQLNGWHELNSRIDIIKERLIGLICWLF